MSSRETRERMTRQVDFVKSIWGRLRVHLESKKDRIYQEIKSYPTPIAGCDDQFNHLLEQQTDVRDEWARLKKAESESVTAEDAVKIIDEFLRSSNHIHPDEEESIRMYMKQGLT